MDDIGFALQRLAREQMKAALMQDIIADLTVCKIENWPYLDYLAELKSLIDGFFPREEGLHERSLQVHPPV